MKIKILNQNDREIEFLLEGSNPQFANALRRIMMSEVPVLAIKRADITVNDSVLYNEILAHRMGMIPLVFNPKSFHFTDKHEEGKTCQDCEVAFALSKKGPCVVYTKDMKSSNPDVKPLYDDMPIVELFEGQELKLEAYASLGMGKDHARHQGAIAAYKYAPSVKVDGLKNADECVKICPKKALETDGKKASVSNACDLCGECVKTADPKGSLKIEGDPTSFIFSIESICGIEPSDLVMQAADILKKKVKDFEKEAKKIK
ncbi:MAG: DNA-directed RNA polymerase subunit D [Candidatus Aenigmarchaeota archaeon]|nr:DNA-directed RNA polymerase subunit D [Candidatus Aenigmarchaeota archaeon]